MDATQAVGVLGALAHENRLTIYRMLVELGPDGLPAGMIAERLGTPPSSLTFHLQQLQQAGLIKQRRMSRKLIYAAELAAMDGLVAYLIENCSEQGSARVLSRAPAAAPKVVAASTA